MKIKNIKLISSDIDGTLIDSSRVIRKDVVDKIIELRDKGYIFGLASGRPVEDILGKYKEWGMSKQFDFLIGYNGGQLYDDKQKTIIPINPLKKEWLKQIIELMSKYSPNVHMYKEDYYLSSKETERAWYSSFKNKRRFVVAENISRFYEEDSNGIMFRCELDKMDQIEKELAELNNSDSEYIGFKTQSDLVEFAHRDTNKGNALKVYAKRYNIDLENCMAFGDTTNDNEMLKICVGVCMKNGTEDTKASAKYITEKTDKEDGFIDFVDEYLL